MVEHPGLNGGKASDLLRQSQQWEARFHPKPFATFSERYLFRALQLHQQHSFHNLEGMSERRLFVVDRKAGSLADARHSPPGH